MKLRTLLMTAITASTLLLSGCWINEGLPTNASNGGSAATTVKSLAANQINTATTGTCDTLPPQEINNVAFTADDTATDVATLTPACKPSP
ncbi:MAG TPA: hypothetical protein VN046_11020 [Stenotrophobium sp.]|jgi:hypothetical protein|nr:hypothetical protein [Stenotrophobium sp.]